ncbi:hypothetical protein TraAM80_07930 [Trypanosoma rangeli]|uniref:Uncharacterized protein n=1 Tax=Trypanosoma rangeli TaxID=5698 RepID=A0A3R7K0Z2_TRYRA|nr:uncharacterized protein TraAM80_07930 [Trypanosoma rangeli]RNE99914.1 hypothetical protein TraAM80_07930 [Trypanosoma rangeli]|eukprot:RNE99914.1 hypothetical protein TraAM80_07930 [Trypanosoma rangeli]
MVGTWLRGQVVKCSADHGVGAIKPFLQAVTVAYSREGALLNVKPTDHIMFFFDDIHTKGGKRPLYAKSQERLTAVLPIIHMGSVVSFTLRHRVFLQKDLMVGACQGIEADRVTVDGEASLKTSSHCLSSIEWLTWREEQRCLESLLQKRGQIDAPITHSDILDSFSVMPIEF